MGVWTCQLVSTVVQTLYLQPGSYANEFKHFLWKMKAYNNVIDPEPISDMVMIKQNHK